MFGMPKFKGHIARRPLEERSEAVRALYREQANRPTKPTAASGDNVYTVGNVLYTALFGWWLALVYYAAGAVVFVTIFGQDYTFMCWRLADYYFFPFNKTVYRVRAGSMTGTPQDRPGGASLFLVLLLFPSARRLRNALTPGLFSCSDESSTGPDAGHHGQPAAHGEPPSPAPAKLLHQHRSPGTRTKRHSVSTPVQSRPLLP